MSRPKLFRVYNKEGDMYAFVDTALVGVELDECGVTTVTEMREFRLYWDSGDERVKKGYKIIADFQKAWENNESSYDVRNTLPKKEIREEDITLLDDSHPMSILEFLDQNNHLQHISHGGSRYKKSYTPPSILEQLKGVGFDKVIVDEEN